MSRRVRVLLAVVLVAVFVGSGSTAAWALWSATGTTGSAVTIGKLSASMSGTDAMTTTFSSTTTTVTDPVTFTNSGSIAGTGTTAVSVVSGSSTALAQAITVQAWPVASTGACTTSSAVGSGSVTGTWASLPSMTSTLAAGASAVWCIRSTPTSAAPPSATTNVHLGLTVTAGSWTAATTGGFYLNSAAATTTATPAFTCQDNGGNSVDLTWDTSARSPDTYYGAVANSTLVGAPEQGYYGKINLAPSDLTASGAADGPVTVDVRVLDANQQPTSTAVATGAITLFEQNSARAIRCGS